MCVSFHSHSVYWVVLPMLGLWVGWEYGSESGLCAHRSFQAPKGPFPAGLGVSGQAGFSNVCLHGGWGIREGDTQKSS
jgi:hypothetical protein